MRRAPPPTSAPLSRHRPHLLGPGEQYPSVRRDHAGRNPQGRRLAQEVSRQTGIPILCHTAERRFLESLSDLGEPVFPIAINMKKAVGALTPRQEKRRHPATMTAKVTFNSDRCKGCELCTTVCPKHIVAIDQAVINRKGYHPAHVTDISQCIACASCAKICPDSIITVEKF